MDIAIGFRIRWIAIYPVESVAQLLSNRGLVITGLVKLFCLQVYTQHRGAKRFGDNMIRLSVNKPKWTGL